MPAGPERFSVVPDTAVAARLAAFAAARGQWLSDLAGALDADRRVAGAWLVGSWGRGETDVWSDVDVVVAAEPQAVPVIVADPVTALSVPGAVLFQLAVPRNAPADGGYLGFCVEMAGLLLWTDWYVWPASTAAVPVDAVVVVERAGVPLPRSAERFMPLLDRHRTTVTEKADRADPCFRLLAVILAAKYLARRDADRLAHMPRLLALEPVDTEHAPVLLRSVLQSMAGVELRPAVTAATALLELAAASGVAPPDEEPA